MNVATPILVKWLKKLFGSFSLIIIHIVEHDDLWVRLWLSWPICDIQTKLHTTETAVTIVASVISVTAMQLMLLSLWLFGTKHSRSFRRCNFLASMMVGFCSKCSTPVTKVDLNRISGFCSVFISPPSEAYLLVVSWAYRCWFGTLLSHMCLTCLVGD